ncbi:MAG: hypothetical protein HZA89_14540 [Verrucomicrobia bacterium]|nr:hypothetical protein [Verrucomicrobiota bacterium]
MQKLGHRPKIQNRLGLVVGALTASATLFVSCEKKPASDLITKEFDRVLAIYCGEDMKVAEEALLSYREKINIAESNRTPGIRFDAARGLVDARLFLLYVKLESPKADEMFPKLAEHFNREREYGGQPKTNITRESLIYGIELLDRTLDVKWKRRQAETK